MQILPASTPTAPQTQQQQQQQYQPSQSSQQPQTSSQSLLGLSQSHQQQRHQAPHGTHYSPVPSQPFTLANVQRQAAQPLLGGQQPQRPSARPTIASRTCTQALSGPSGVAAGWLAFLVGAAIAIGLGLKTIAQQDWANHNSFRDSCIADLARNMTYADCEAVVSQPPRPVPRSPGFGAHLPTGELAWMIFAGARCFVVDILAFIHIERVDDIALERQRTARTVEITSAPLVLLPQPGILVSVLELWSRPERGRRKSTQNLCHALAGNKVLAQILLIYATTATIMTAFELMVLAPAMGGTIVHHKPVPWGAVSIASRDLQYRSSALTAFPQILNMIAVIILITRLWPPPRPALIIAEPPGLSVCKRVKGWQEGFVPELRPSVAIPRRGYDAQRRVRQRRQADRRASNASAPMLYS